ncbi:peptidase S8/S53 domain-containing protein [Lactarius akahatsu]|uniref:Peptidase S8/S53 domain-containing protein n=1 Tax=Lactarius akahatsu TaxID=416441 RepID=A0AAD4LAC5_9AGAM|nr:peptidase S8/S53 domain-containing protein [Lactarius akahatsu]
MAHPGLYVLEPAKQVERSDRQLQQAQALYEGYQAKMDRYDRALVQSLLVYSGDLRYGFEDKYLLTRVRQARLYCNRVGETLRMIQMAVEKAIDMRAHSVQIRVPVWPRHANSHVVFDVREFEDQLVVLAVSVLSAIGASPAISPHARISPCPFPRCGRLGQRHHCVTLGVTSGTTRALKLRQSIEPPLNWVNLGRAPSSYIIPLRIALRQPRFSELEQHLSEISDPFHPSYGKHLLKEDVEALVAPRASSVDAVHEWLESHGIQKEACHQSPAGDWVTVRLPVVQMERMLGTYSLPPHLDEHIELIQPTTVFNRAKAQRTTYHFIDLNPVASSQSLSAKVTAPGSGVTVDASCNMTITVSCLKQLYNAVNYVPQAPDKNAIALSGYLEQFANFADLKQFYADQVPAAVNTSFDVVLINGGLNNQTLAEAGSEADLDVQFALGISFPTLGTFYSTGGRAPYIKDALTPNAMNEPYGDWLDFVLAQHKSSLRVMAMMSKVSPWTTRTVCAEALLNLVLHLLFTSLCDGGVGDGDPDPATQNCFTTNGKNQTKFLPYFPASCGTSVTAVGATTQIPEVAAHYSGGGFSNYFHRPSWQRAAVTKFLQSLPDGTYTGLFNASGRAFPDISAQGSSFRIFYRGRPARISGTSASAPSLAAFVALLNDVRIAAGKPSLGFLNPLIYALNGVGLNNITARNAPGCGTPGFNAMKG